MPPRLPDQDRRGSDLGLANSTHFTNHSGPGSRRNSEKNSEKKREKEDRLYGYYGQVDDDCLSECNSLNENEEDKSIDDESFQARKIHFKNFLLETWRPAAALRKQKSENRRGSNGSVMRRDKVSEEEVWESERRGLAQRAMLSINKGNVRATVLT